MRRLELAQEPRQRIRRPEDARVLEHQRDGAALGRAPGTAGQGGDPEHEEDAAHRPDLESARLHEEVGVPVLGPARLGVLLAHGLLLSVTQRVHPIGLDAAPGDDVPGDVVPGDAVPGDAVPGRVVTSVSGVTGDSVAAAPPERGGAGAAARGGAETSTVTVRFAHAATIAAGTSIETANAQIRWFIMIPPGFRRFLLQLRVRWPPVFTGPSRPPSMI